ncbi:MAG: metal ABC transporter ATP-binding protein [Gemmataceae bacterium]|nr:metal ABC transporter ATP-binding protein [Gemmataceae bacterium]
MTPLVSLDNVGVTLGGVPILQGVTAQLPRGKIVALIGLNGSGKTTLLRAILREIPCTGTIRFHCGHDHQHATPQHVGYVPQKLRLEANLPLTVCDLLAVSLQRRPLFLGVARSLRRQIADMLTRVGAPLSLLDRPMDKLSGGEQQRVLLALAMHPDPELLLLDEPAAGIDFKDQESFYQLIARLNHERGVTILLVSHDLSIVHKHAHQVLCLKDGRIQCEGSPHELSQGVLAQVFGAEAALYRHHHPHG